MIIAVISHSSIDAVIYEYAKVASVIKTTVTLLMRELSLVLVPDTFIFRSISPILQRMTEIFLPPLSPLPPCIAVTKDLCARILCFLHQQSAALSSCIFLRTTTAKDENMEPTSRCDLGQLAYRLHGIWRSRCTIPDCEMILSIPNTLRRANVGAVP